MGQKSHPMVTGRNGRRLSDPDEDRRAPQRILRSAPRCPASDRRERPDFGHCSGGVGTHLRANRGDLWRSNADPGNGRAAWGTYRKTRTVTAKPFEVCERSRSSPFGFRKNRLGSNTRQTRCRTSLWERYLVVSTMSSSPIALSSSEALVAFSSTARPTSGRMKSMRLAARGDRKPGFDHAAAPWYSWISPPSRSRRRTSRGLTSIGSHASARGGARPSARWGRPRL